MSKINFNIAEFRGSCFEVSRLSLPKKPEIVIAGRSNAGKSSIINTLLNRKNFARTGSAPGKTVSINFFEAGRAVYLTDLPGYGYARRSSEQRRSWGKLIEDYFDLGRDIRLCVLAVDIRHEPSADDMQMYEYLMSRGYLFCIAATKCDKLSKTQVISRTGELSEIFGIDVIPFSAVDRTGADRLRQIIEDVADPADNEEELI